MQVRSLKWLLAVTVISGCGEREKGVVPAPGLEPTGEGVLKTDPQPMSRKVTTEWVAAGGHVGWIHVNKFGYPQFTNGPGQTGDWPAFRFQTWRKGAILGLPNTHTAFGLVQTGDSVTDDAINELAEKSDLVSLSLDGAAVTNDGLERLSQLKNLKSLSLGITETNDAGVKSISRIKSLEYLALDNTKVTDDGMKEIAGLSSLLIRR